MFCVVCKKVVTYVCDRCRQYHCDDHDCPIGSSRDDMAIVPILAQVDDSSGDGSGETVNTEEIHHEDPVVEAQAEEDRNRYRTGSVAAILLAAWIAYATWSERRNEGLGFQRMQALKAIDKFSGLLIPGQTTSVSPSLYAFDWRRYLFTQGFKFGIIPTPMPFPRVFASMADIKLTMRLGLFSLFANNDEFARFIQMVNQANPMRAVPQLIETDIVSLRRRMLGWSGSGFGLGSGTYSTAYSLIASRIRFPLITGIMNSTVLSLQMPWDIAMTFNHFAVNVGQNARTLQTMSPESYARAIGVMKMSLKSVYPRLIASSLVATAVTSGVGVPLLMMKYLSKDK